MPPGTRATAGGPGVRPPTDRATTKKTPANSVASQAGVTPTTWKNSTMPSFDGTRGASAGAAAGFWSAGQ